MFYDLSYFAAALQGGAFVAWLAACFPAGGNPQALILFRPVRILGWRCMAIVTVFFVFVYAKLCLQGNYFSFKPVNCPE